MIFDAVTRRFFVGLGAAGTTVWTAPLAPAGDTPAEPEYLTPLARIKPDGRGNPRPCDFTPEQRRPAGLVPETWSLEVVADTESAPAPDLARSLTLDWPGLMRLAAKNTVRYLHVGSCTNVPDPLHMCLWEGVPLRDVIWMARPKANVRRVWYRGPESENFHSSLPLDRVLEEAPGELPVILAFKMNDREIPGPLGGPVRLIAPGFYANRSMKWIRHLVLTNDFRANDSYAEGNNDVESRLKSYARFVQPPSAIPAHKSSTVTGLAQVGISGLSQVQVCVFPEGRHTSQDDPWFEKAPWRPAEILPAPKAWGGGVTAAPDAPLQFDPADRKPRTWPMRHALVHWAAQLPGLEPGPYTLCCRTIDAHGLAQPMPRPLPRTGWNAIHRVRLMAEA